MTSVIGSLRGGLIVSCQPQPDSTFKGPRVMALFARAAEMGGAAGIRANGPADVRAINRATPLPIIGINKIRNPRWPVFITPTLRSARPLLAAGADIIAVDATFRGRPANLGAAEFIRLLSRELTIPVMADVATFEEGMAAAEAGASLVATTLAGYTDSRPRSAGPDLELLAQLASHCPVPVICEGRIHSPQDVAAAFSAGAFAVVVGNAITNPTVITRLYAAEVPQKP
jgi:N-acylglucosamine-6-phosphate 2-epimerase